MDIGGTKLAAGVVDEAGRVWHAERLPTPSGDAEAVWASLARVIERVRVAAAAVGAPVPRGVGVGCGGPMRWPDGVVSPLNIGGWRAFPLRERLTELLPGEPVRVHNDAIAFAAGEHWRGAGRGRHNLLGIVVSTGVGGGLVVRDRIVDGTTGNAGHIGHVVVDPAGPSCACGGRGCLEAIASGPATVAWARSNGWRAGQSDGLSLVADARAGHPVALAALARAGEALGVAIASAAALCDLQLIVIGGGLAAAGELLFGPLRKALARHARLSFTAGVPVMAAAGGEHAGLVGAAALVLAGDRYWSAG